MNVINIVTSTLGGLFKPKTTRRRGKKRPQRRRRRAYFSKTPRRYGR